MARPALLIGVVAALLVVIGVALSGLGLMGPAPATVSIDGSSYYDEPASLSLPLCGQSGNLSSQVFHGVAFAMQLSHWCDSAGGLLNGTVEESGGSTFDFNIAGISGPTPYLTWISPDKYCGAEWNRNSTAILLVETTGAP